jgi:prophage maintenance system killer protein
MPQETKTGEIIIYQSSQGPALSVSVSDDTVWLTQAQIAELFQTDRSSITKHLRNIINSGELREKSNVQILHIANSDRPVKHYNLDFILSVGYRVNSKRATQFRIWATQKLRDLLMKGLVVDEKRLRESQEARLKDLQDASRFIRQALGSRKLVGYEKELLNIIADYTDTWVVLSRYDEGRLRVENVRKKPAKTLEYAKAKLSIDRFRDRLMQARQASGLFGREVNNKLAAILGNIQQGFDGSDVYPSIEEKGAHLLYLVIKDHPFVDGNKRIASLLFLMFLVENNILYGRSGERKINDSSLVALALLIAESKPSEKEVMINLIVNLINK